ncbi:hypothetical protein IV203_001348 [Nitzschia inconspicua]|uniref:Uncharacterized protein n=1 Tax=Nitzschia inconspicua TaxID=303405 RepID=A0A9K3L6Z3_9STRA|nr:hypothetical protein IV203_001348 [Nitzschia inconspicua]
MRKIYKPTWSGASSTAGSSSHHSRDKLSLLGHVASTEDDPNGVTNSSFDTNTSHYSSSHKMAVAGKQLVQHHTTIEAHPVQFVPAHHEGPVTSTSTDTAPTTSSVEETSWDAIANSDSFEERHYNNNYNTRRASSVVVMPTANSSTRRGTCASRSKLFTCKPQQQQQGEDTRSVSVVSSVQQQSVGGGRSAPGSTSNNNTRIARLASLFSSRALTPDRATMAPQAPSPPSSESSSAYVAWPGTQDKRGGTVVVESSYDESSAGAARSAANSSAAGPPKSYAEEVDEAVDRQVHQWMASDSASETSSPGFQPTQIRSNIQTKTPPRPAIHARAEQDKVHRMTSSTQQGAKISPLDREIHSIQDVYGREEDNGEGMMTINATEQWDDTMSDLSTSYSKTSSAYFNTREVHAIRKGHAISGVRHNRQAVTSVMRRFQTPSQRGNAISQTPSLTEETLAMKDQLEPPRRPFNAASVGYRGLLDKTQDVPNLMDDVESDSTSAASAATSRHSSAIHDTVPNTSYRAKRSDRYNKRERVILEEEDGQQDRDGAESNVFDGISNVGRRRRAVEEPTSQEDIFEEENGGILGATSRAEMEKLNLALLGGGLTTIQTTSDDFMNRRTASDFDENLTNSDCDQYGFTKIPAFHQMAVAGMSKHDRSLSSQSLLFSTPSERARRILEKHTGRNSRSDSGSSLFSERFPSDGLGQNMDGDLSQYYVHPDEMKIVVKKFRKISQELYPRLDYEDLEREEDAAKAFALSEMRSRIMETDIERGLERRGGTTVVDDIVLTPFNRAAMRVRDAVIVAKAWRDGATPQDVINTSLLTRRGERSYYIPRLVTSSSRGASKYTWEEVTWVDDLELSQYRCHSIGPRHLKGVEMFTIGDCQSILLKLCNERCQELRADLNMATARQIEAEEIMKEDEGETFDGMMTEAEMTYLTSMEEVKSISHKLVLAEKAFTLVKDRIEKLVAKYEALLVRFENETGSVAPSSVFTCESSCYTDDYSFATAEEREKEALARRAQRAELRAELAAREALLAKQQAQQVRHEKEKELKDLRSRLAELQSESSAAITEREHSVVLARAITANSRAGGAHQNRVVSSGANRISRTKIDDVKQRFRNRSAAKVGQTASQPSMSPVTGNVNSLHRTVGEEMFQHLDFYERSLKAVEIAH